MKEEAAHELPDRHSHDFALMTATLPAVLPAEADVGLIDVEQATVGDSDTVGVARQISQDLLGTGEGLFRVDDPFGCAQRRESGGKCLRLVERCEIGKELQFAGLECYCQTFEKQAPEQAREYANRKKESGLAGNPTLAVRREAATGNDAMKMRGYAERRIMPSSGRIGPCFLSC